MFKKIAMFGVFPPPYGGRSIHIKRVAKKLIDNNKIVDIYSNTRKDPYFNLRTTKSIIFHVFIKKYDILHFHERNYKLISVLVTLSILLKYKTIVTYHSFRDNPEDYGKMKKALFYFSIKRVNKFICVGENEKNKLSKYIPSNKIDVVPSFIPPYEVQGEYEALPSKVKGFIKESEFLITANGNIRFYKGHDLYGFDLLIELMNELVNSLNKKTSLLIALLGVKDQTQKEQEYYLYLREKVRKYSLEKQICFYEVEDTELYPILKRSNLFIRPTNTDSFGISVAEAIYAGVPSIASDICERPKGTILFKTRSYEDLLLKVKEVQNNYYEYKKYFSEIKLEDNSNCLLKIYEDLIKG